MLQDEEMINERVVHLGRLLRASQKRLNELEIQKARYGINARPEIITEMDDIEDEIKRYKNELEKLQTSLAVIKSQEIAKFTKVDYKKVAPSRSLIILSSVSVALVVVLSCALLFVLLNRSDIRAISSTTTPVMPMPSTSTEVISATTLVIPTTVAVPTVTGVDSSAAHEASFVREAVKGVRVGVADGQRLRVVIDIVPFVFDNIVESVEISPLNLLDTIRISMPIVEDDLPPINYDSLSAMEVANARLEMTPDGLAILISPKVLFESQNMFLLSHDYNNVNDRLVVDFCYAQVCPPF